MKTPKEIGDILKAARLKKALSIASVNKITRIQTNVIEALEGGKAHETLARVYLLLFLKRYAAVLDLDGDDLRANYKAFYTEEEKKPFDIGEASLETGDPSYKWISLIIFAIVVIIVMFFILFLGILKSKSSERAGKTLPVRSVVKSAPLRKTPKAAESKSSREIFPIPAGRPISLRLVSTDDVWMKVMKDGEVVFEDIFSKNSEISFSAENTIGLWVGRTEALKFTVNGKLIGKVGRGTIKDIEISRHGFKIGNKWLLRSRE